MSVARKLTRNQVRFRQICVIFVTSVITGAGLSWTIFYSSYEGLDKWDNVAYTCMMCLMSWLFIALDSFEKFHNFHLCLENLCDGQGQAFLSISFLILGFADYIMIETYYSLMDGDGPLALLITLYIVYYASLILLFCTWMVYWEVFAFYCSEYPYIHGFMYISVVGGLALVSSRWIRPPIQGDWHWHPGTDIILNGVLNVISFFFIFLVVLVGIGISLFSEFGQNVNEMGTPLAFTLLGILSMIVMLTPMAPGNIVDVCGGFVIVQILIQEEKLGFWTAWAVAIAAVCVLHFAGACAQWYIGKQPCVQSWGNVTLPVPMLAASDAVLKEADCFRVGLIGYVFMDTANGLNQGRINMEFWTQLLSEWTCLPNAIPLVSLGATVAVAGDKSLQWTKLALPVLLLLATCWQMVGTSFGASAMGASADTEKYWTSREKWTLIQLFYRTGYSATQLGWSFDVYQLAKSGQEKYVKEGNTLSLYTKIHNVHMSYLDQRDNLDTEADRLARYQQYQEEIANIREKHIVKVHDILEFGIEAGWLVYKKPEPKEEGWFDKEGNLGWKKLMISVLVCCYWASIIGI